MRMIILCGLPGVGKLTIAKELALLRGYRVFHNHLVFDAVEAFFPFGSPTFIELRQRLWIELLSRSVGERVGDVIFTIARDQALPAEFLVTLTAALSGLGAQVFCFELACGPAEHQQRLASVDRTRFGKLNSVERFRELSAKSAFPTFTMPSEAISIQTTGLSASEAAAIVDGEINRVRTAD